MIETFHLNEDKGYNDAFVMMNVQSKHRGLLENSQENRKTITQAGKRKRMVGPLLLLLLLLLLGRWLRTAIDEAFTFTLRMDQN
ncbi:hypothetical protein T05_1494 [Trichinella murrelli]|uniref:Uncharacterized protein n=1 Tax=Trichinella murrelli TaxID=144512 RepID=A0A0V0U1P2_9BILA|nr:hypothetical protein T05_1494 [Trichinella murrelli]